MQCWYTNFRRDLIAACIKLVYSYLLFVMLVECASTPGKLKSLPDHGGNQTRNLWDTTELVHCSTN